MEIGGPVLPGTKRARGPPTVGSLGRPPERRVGGAGGDAGSFRSAGGGRGARPSPGRGGRLGVFFTYVFLK